MKIFLLLLLTTLTLTKTYAQYKLPYDSLTHHVTYRNVKYVTLSDSALYRKVKEWALTETKTHTDLSESKSPRKSIILGHGNLTIDTFNIYFTFKVEMFKNSYSCELNNIYYNSLNDFSIQSAESLIGRNNNSLIKQFNENFIYLIYKLSEKTK